MEFIDLAALTIHDVKNRLAILAHRAEVNGDGDTLHDALACAATLTRLLTYYKKEKGLLTLDVDAHVPADLLEELALEVSKQTSIRLETRTADAPTLWFYDENLVRMALISALNNATHYAKTSITLTAECINQFLVFSVHDDGSGFPDDLLSKEPGLLPVNPDGTGLGLHLARYVAALHCNDGRRGFIRLENRDGAHFTMHIPQ